MRGNFRWDGPVPVRGETPIPLSFFDDFLSHLSGSEAKVIIWLFRCTTGSARPRVRLSIAMIADATGLSRTTISHAVQTLVAKGMIRRHQETAGSTDAFIYALCSVPDETIASLPDSYDIVPVAAATAMHAPPDGAIQDREQVARNNIRAARCGATGRITAQEWAALKEAAGHACACCGAVVDRLTIDHVIPLSRGGSNTIDNAQGICGLCNSLKGDLAVDWRSGGV